jgi:branched-chain amino acid aminotransferase
MRAIPNPKQPSEILLFRLHDHAKRLAHSAKFFGCTQFDVSFFEATLVEFVTKNRPTRPIYIRPLIYTSDLDLSPRLHDIEWDVLVYGLEMGDYLKPEGITCTISSWQRQQDASFPLRGKISGAYITSALAKTEAVKR